MVFIHLLHILFRYFFLLAFFGLEFLVLLGQLIQQIRLFSLHIDHLVIKCNLLTPD
jgi:hypothetical protein